jgi:hypothetical protein
MANWREKELLPAILPVSERRPQTFKWRVLALIALLAVPMAFRCATHVGPLLPGRRFGSLSDANLCPQADSLYPDRHAVLWESLGKDFSQDAFALRAVEWLGGAVRVP